MTETFDVFTRESSYCFQRVLRRLSHRNSVRLSVCPSRVNQSKTVQARIIKFIPSAV